MADKPIQKIIVTGGAGYIGSHTIVELLEKTSYEVVSIDNFSNSAPQTFDRIFEITGKRVRNHDINLCDATAVARIFEEEKNIAGVIHFAAYKSVPDSVADPGKYYHNNFGSLLSVADACVTFNVPDLIFSSSCSVYGNIASLPVSEDTPLMKAESPYGHTKQVGEDILRNYAQAHSLRVVALRYFNPVGAHMSGKLGELPLNKPNNLVPLITGTAIGKYSEVTVFGGDYPTRDGTCIRDYVHVSDIAAAHLNALQYLQKKSGNRSYSVFNVGNGNGVSVLEAIRAFEKVSGRKLNYRIGPRRPGDVEAIYSSNKLSETLLGWKPAHSLEDMMNSAWLWEMNLQPVR